MAEHIRRCVKCQAGFPCSHLDEMIGQMTDVELIQAAGEVVTQRKMTLRQSREYQREYMRKWRAKRG